MRKVIVYHSLFVGIWVVNLICNQLFKRRKWCKAWGYVHLVIQWKTQLNSACGGFSDVSYHTVYQTRNHYFSRFSKIQELPSKLVLFFNLPGTIILSKFLEREIHVQNLDNIIDCGCPTKGRWNVYVIQNIWVVSGSQIPSTEKQWLCTHIFSSNLHRVYIKISLSSVFFHKQKEKPTETHTQDPWRRSIRYWGNARHCQGNSQEHHRTVACGPSQLEKKNGFLLQLTCKIITMKQFLWEVQEKDIW